MCCDFMASSVIASHAHPDLPLCSCSFPCSRSHRQTGQKRPIQQTCLPSYFGRWALMLRSLSCRSLHVCHQKSGFVLRLVLRDMDQFKMLQCMLNIIYINIYKHQCAHTSDIRAIMYTSMCIYIRETLRSCHLPKETLARVCKQSSVKSSELFAGDFWKHSNLQWCVGVWNCKHALFIFSIIIIAWLLMTGYSKF